MRDARAALFFQVAARRGRQQLVVGDRPVQQFEQLFRRIFRAAPKLPGNAGQAQQRKVAAVFPGDQPERFDRFGGELFGFHLPQGFSERNSG
ncbi:hypothetical protein SDC9_158638 [bioreactor metagenome]|uniref:Uncharacterized protein n=1 Tax=bioreactor metagenome TaxID=1076179 RepID=A0A645FAQ3_9ZZZZ